MSGGVIEVLTADLTRGCLERRRGTSVAAFVRYRVIIAKAIRLLHPSLFNFADWWHTDEEPF
jgi:hypothetical protein